MEEFCLLVKLHHKGSAPGNSRASFGIFALAACHKIGFTCRETIAKYDISFLLCGLQTQIKRYIFRKKKYKEEEKKSFLIFNSIQHTDHSISNRKFCCFSYIIAMVHQNSLTVEFWQEKIEGSLRRANTKSYKKKNVNLSKRVRKDRVFLGLAGLLLGISLWLCPRKIPCSSPASHWKTPSFPPLLLRLTQYDLTELHVFYI